MRQSNSKMIEKYMPHNKILHDLFLHNVLDSTMETIINVPEGNTPVKENEENDNMQKVLKHEGLSSVT